MSAVVLEHDLDADDPSPCDLGDHDLLEVSYDAPVSTQCCQRCGLEEDVDVTDAIAEACVEVRERALYGGDS